jgi:hypothetical protein
MQQLLVARIREQLRGGSASKTSEPELRKDWKLLEAAFSDDAEEAAMRRKTNRDTLESMTLP